MVFIAELFWWFETVKPEFVQPRDLQEFKDGKCTVTDAPNKNEVLSRYHCFLLSPSLCRENNKDFARYL